MSQESEEQGEARGHEHGSRTRNAKTIDVRPDLDTPDDDLIVRLDAPFDNSTVLSDRVEVRGWFLANDAEAQAIVSDPSAIEVLLGEDCERDISLYSGMNFFGHNLREDRPGADVKLESFELLEVDPLKYGPLADRTRRPYDIRGTLLLRTAVTALASGSRTFRLCIRVAIGARVSISNPVVFSILPRGLWAEARGGLSFPIARTIHSSFLIIEGWALKLGDALAQVEIFFGEHPVGSALTGLPSPKEHESLPDPEESANCRFSLTCSRKELTPAAWATNFFEESFSISARCKFQSGFELVLSGPQFRWAAPNGGSEPYGEIETVRLAGEGLLEVSGWVVNPMSTPLRFFLEGRVFRIELIEDAQLRRFPRPDITAQFISDDRLQQTGFSFQVHPAALGRFPGIARLCVEAADGSARMAIGPAEAWENISTRIHSAVKLDAKEKLKAEVSKKLCRRGFRKDFAPAPSALPTSPLQTLPQKPERFLIASHNLAAVEGAPKVLSQIVRTLVDSGNDPQKMRVVSAHDGPLKKFYNDLGIDVRIIPEFALFQQTWDRYQTGLSELERETREFSPHLVLANVIDSFWAADFAARAELPCFWILHESVKPKTHFFDLEPQLRLAFLERVSTPIEDGGARLGFVAESTRQLFNELRPHDDSIVIPNGIDLRAIEEQKKKLFRAAARSTLELTSEFVIAIVGTTTRRKGQDTFLRAVHRLVQIQPRTDFKFFIVGARDIPFLYELQALVEELGLKKRVTFVRETTDIAKYYIAADALVVASREESAPLVSLEAFAYERPLVSTAVFGLADQVEHEVNALVFDPEDANGLADALGRLVSDPALREQLVEGGSKTVRERFTVERANAQYLVEIRTTYNAWRSSSAK